MSLKNILAVIAIFALPFLMLSSCSDTKTSTTTTAAPGATLAATTTTTTIPLVSAEIKALQAKATKISSMKYTESATKDAVFIKGAKARRNLFVTRDLKIARPYNSVYIDSAAKKAYGVCTSLCDPEYKLKYWPVNYNDFDIEDSPLIMINSIVSGTFDTMQTKRIGNFPVTYMSFTDLAGRQGVMWISMFYGVPLEYTINNVKTEYLYIAFNSLTDTDVNVPSGYTELTV